MTNPDGVERFIVDWLADAGAQDTPRRVYDASFDAARRTRRARPLPDFLTRWLPMTTNFPATRHAPLGRSMSLARLGLALTLLALALLGAALFASVVSPSPAVTVRNGRIAFGSENDIYTVAPDGSDRRFLVEGSDTLAGLAWSPDGTRLAHWSEASQLNVVDADGSDPTLVASRDATIGSMSVLWGSPVWSPDSSKLAFIGDTLGGPQTACDGASDTDSGHCTSRVFVVEVDADGSTGPVQVGDPDMNARTAAWSPDGDSIAFTSGDPQKEGMALYVMDADGENVRRIDEVSGTGWSFGKLAWSPDGRSIAATAGMGSRDIWVFASDGSTATMVSETPEDPTKKQGNPAYAPDGSTLPRASAAPGTRTENQGNPAYAPDGALAWSGWLLEVGGTPRTMAVWAYPWSAPVWSPDGQFIAGRTDATGDVVIIDRDGTIVARIEGPTFEYAVSWQPLPG